jgi:hypothetical protein
MLGFEIKDKNAEKTLHIPFCASGWMPNTVNKRQKGKPCTDKHSRF